MCSSDLWFTNSVRPRINIDTITLLNRIWTDPKGWLIAPESVVWELAHYRPLFISELKNPPPARICYKIRHRYPNVVTEQAVSSFEEKLSEYLKDLHRAPELGLTARQE